jgi:hypothetical protein
LKDENRKISHYKIKKISLTAKKNNQIRSFKRQIGYQKKEQTPNPKITLSWRVRWKKDLKRLPIKEKITNESYKTEAKE